jgi:hypothetical protein
MSSLFKSVFWLDAAERAVKTAAQAGILAIGASEGFNLFTLDWRTFAGFAAGGAFLSMLMSVASAGVGDNESASLVKGVK